MEHLENMDYSAFLGRSETKKCANKLREAANLLVIDVLHPRRHDKLANQKTPPSTSRGRGLTPFVMSPALRAEDDDAFVIIKRRLGKPVGKGGRKSQMTELREAAFDRLTGKLKETAPYVPIHLSDDEYGIPDNITNVDQRARCRADFREYISQQAAFSHFSVGVHIQRSVGPHPACISQFRLSKDYERTRSILRNVIGL